MGHRQLVFVLPKHLPRRSLFAATVIPALLFLALSLAVGVVFNWSGYDHSSRIRIAGGDIPDVQVRERFWRVAKDGRPEEVVAPDGERYTPEARPVVGWSRAVLYNPYEVGPESTEDFAAYQYSRAYHDIYGGTIDPDFVKEHYVLTSADWPYQRLPPLPPRDGRWNRVAAGLVLFSLIWLLAMLAQTVISPFVSGPHWYKLSNWLRTTAAPLIGVFIFSCMLLGEALNSGPGEMFSTLVLIQIQHIPDLLPASAPLAVAAALAILALTYLAGQELFARRETLMGGGVVTELNG